MLTCKTCHKDLFTQGKNKKARYCNTKCANKWYYSQGDYTPVSDTDRKQEKPIPNLSENERNRKNLISQRYRLGWQEYLTLYETQSGGCALCKIPLGISKDTPDKEVAHVDHCHTTGKVRGLLCSKCNKGLGHFFDNSVTLRLAAEYIERHK
jgi:hypothetical protein